MMDCLANPYREDSHVCLLRPLCELTLSLPKAQDWPDS